MKKQLVIILCAALVLGIGSLACAAPSFFGPTGLIVMPTADTLNMGQFNLYAATIDIDDDEYNPPDGTAVYLTASGPIDGDSGGGRLTNFGVNAGVGFGFEVGGTMLDPEGGDSEFIVNAKWAFMQESLLKPGVAIGALNVLDNDDFGGLQPYVVLSKALSIPGSDIGFSGHAGYIAGDIDKLMLGASANVTPQLTLMADWIDDFTDVSYGIRYAATDALRVDAALIDGDFAFGASYVFGLQ